MPEVEVAVLNLNPGFYAIEKAVTIDAGLRDIRGTR